MAVLIICIEKNKSYSNRMVKLKEIISLHTNSRIFADCGSYFVFLQICHKSIGLTTAAKLKVPLKLSGTLNFL